MFRETRERRDEILIPIEDFNEKLNDAQTFELYTDERHENSAISLIENCIEETFFDDCIFTSGNYDEVFEVYLLLRNNNIQCGDIFPNIDNYLLFVDPEDKDAALKILNRQNTQNTAKIQEFEEEKPNVIFAQENHENNMLKYILPLVIIPCLFLIKINNESIIEIIISKIKIIIEEMIPKPLPFP